MLELQHLHQVHLELSQHTLLFSIPLASHMLLYCTHPEKLWDVFSKY